MKVTVDPAKCTGHGRCYSLAPEVFTSDDQGRGMSATDELSDPLRDKARTGMLNCPEQAITIEDP